MKESWITEHPNLRLTDKDRLDMRINALSIPVKTYLAYSEALQNTTLEPEVLSELHKLRLDTFATFEPEQIQELGEFLSFRDSLPPKK